MKITEFSILKGVFKIELDPKMDERGFFMRTFDEKMFIESNLNPHWPQENQSRNTKKNIIRGLHFYLPPHDEVKMVRVMRGKVLDVVVDLRKGSKTFAKWDALELFEDDHEWLYIPKGFAHGFCTLSDQVDLLYKHGGCFQPEYDSGIIWNDPDLNISWPFPDPFVSTKDNLLMRFKEFEKNYGGL